MTNNVHTNVYRSLCTRTGSVVCWSNLIAWQILTKERQNEGLVWCWWNGFSIISVMRQRVSCSTACEAVDLIWKYLFGMLMTHSKYGPCIINTHFSKLKFGIFHIFITFYITLVAQKCIQHDINVTINIYWTTIKINNKIVVLGHFAILFIKAVVF